MSKPIIFSLHLDDNYKYVDRDAYEEAIDNEVETLMRDGYDAGHKMYEILCEDPVVTLFGLLYGNEEEQQKVREVIEKAFRKEAEENVLSDWTAVPLTESDVIGIFRELGAATVNALVAKAFG